MELKELLQLDKPSMAEMDEAVMLLTNICAEATHLLGVLDEEERARAADRIMGVDDGGTERAAARTRALKTLDDAGITRAAIQARQAQEVCRLAKEADDKIWAEIQSNLIDRSEALGKIDVLLNQVEALYQTSAQLLLKARNAMPVQIDGYQYAAQQGGGPGMLEAAIIAKLNFALGSPLSVFRIEGQQLGVLAQAVRCDGLAGFVAPVDRFLLSYRA